MAEFLFIWIPKTGGTSVYSAMKKDHRMKLILSDYQSFNNAGSVTFGHADVRQLIAKKIVTKEYWQKCTPFLVVRNPYTRAISLWQDFIRSNRIGPNTTLAQFLFAQSVFERRPGLFNVMDYSQCASQVQWILPGVKILRFENLKREFYQLTGCDLPHMNSGNIEDPMKYYDNESIRIANELYYDSFALLGYEMEG